MLRSALILIVIGFTQGVSAQNIELKVQDSIMGKYDHFSVDNFGRMYLCKEDVIIQFSSTCDTLFSASLKQLQPTSLESSKSFRTLLFDSERQVIHFYDNTLTDIHGEIDLVIYDIQQPILVCESFAGNTFWILDAGTMRLIKMNNKLEVISQTERISNVFTDENMPFQMLESNEYLYVAIPDKGVALFDVFGTFIKIIPCKPDRISVVKNYLLVREANKIHVYPVENLMDSEFSYDIPDDVTEFSFDNDKVYLLRETGLYIGEFVEE